MSKTQSLEHLTEIEHKIHLIRGHKVMLDRDLAILYGVRAIALRQQVKRNRERFPTDFMFQLTEKEVQELLSQTVIPSRTNLGGSRPYVFTQEGVAMLSSVLRSRRAIQMNIAIMRAFVRLREIIAAHKELADRIEKLEKNQGDHASILSLLVEEIEQIKALPESSKPKIGFHPK